MNNFSYKKNGSGTDIRIQTTSDTPSWVLLNGIKYWSMQVSEDSNTQVEYLILYQVKTYIINYT